MEKIYIRTFGCQANVRDSEFIAGLFLRKGYKLADSPESADVILYNTCSVRAHAEQRAISNMGALLKDENQKPKTKNPKPKIFGIVGCMAQAMKKELFRKLPGLDIVCGTGEIARLPELVEQVHGQKVIALDNIDGHIPELASDYRKGKKHAYVSIMRGCDNFCSYCIVPYVRGRERSRNAGDIIKEIEGLIKKGIRDITLLGQNVNSYKGLAYSVERIADSNKKKLYAKRYPLSAKTCNFVQLLYSINDIDGIERINFLTSHPKDATVKLFEAMRDLDKIVKHLHLPLQSGSNRILKLMNRGYTREKYLNLINKARILIPNLRLTTDIIVGFPTETENDFNDTLNLMKEIKFDLAYIFKYSPRPGIKASRMIDDVPEATKKKRNNLLLNAQIKISKERANEKNNYFCRS